MVSKASALLGHRMIDHYRRVAAAGLPDPQAINQWTARHELAGSLRALGRDVEARRLAAYRAYVGATVSAVSLLPLRLCEREGIELDRLVLGLAPDMPRTHWLCGRSPADPRCRIKGRPASLHKVAPREAVALDLEWFAHSGLVVRDRLHDRPFGIRVLDAGLEVGMLLGGARLRTHGDEGSITVAGELPATLVRGLPGMPLDALIEDAMLAGAGCVIRRVDEPRPWGTRIVFGLEPAAWTMPWARTSPIAPA